jgi:hypothetical protein
MISMISGIKQLSLAPAPQLSLRCKTPGEELYGRQQLLAVQPARRRQRINYLLNILYH